jgi:fatty-acyl-CoA synthase
MDGWHFADVFEVVARAAPERVAVVHGDRRLTWRDFDRRANALAADLLAAGLGRQAKVMTYLYNAPEYLETYYGALKAAMVPVNVNYRYGPDEVAYLFDNADAEAAVFDVRFAPLLNEIRPRLPAVRRWLAVGERVDVPSWATPYEDVVGAGLDTPPALAWPRSGDDVIMVFTGGTTGMPKGVLWAHEDLFRAMGQGGVAVLGIPPVDSLDELEDRARAQADQAGPVVLQACPLMHATALGNTFQMLPAGATIVLLPGRSFDAAELWDEVDRNAVSWLTIVGDAFGRPLLAELEARPDRWHLSSLQVIYSAGVMWSKEVKEGLLRHLPPDTRLFDVLGSTEAPALGVSVSGAAAAGSGGAASATATFTIGEHAQVITEDGRFVEPGSGEVGMAAFGGHMPRGYYKDDAKTASTFRVVGGKRWSVPGDFATVDADGTLHLLGRGSVCIHSGGE